MSTVQQLLDDINLRYKNTFSTAQKVVWMNEVQKELFQKARVEAVPFYFTTVSGQSWYALPNDCDPDDIQRLTIETGVGTGYYNPLPFKRMDEEISESEEFYTIQTTNTFLNPVPTTTTAGRRVHIYYFKKPIELSETALSASPELQEAYQPLLKLGVLIIMAQANEDAVMANNFTTEYNTMERQLKLERYNQAPVYPVVKDVRKKRSY